MSDSSAFGFGKFIPGFDFLQNLTKAGSAMPKMSHWIAPTVSVEDLDKRITELKAVQFWLEQNSRALAATVQALEVQKMTLATLQGMNLQMGDIAKAFTMDPMAAMESLRQATQAAAGAASAAANAPFPAPAAPAASPTQPPVASPAPAAQASQEAEAQQQPKAAAAVDPLQWWGALTQQFQSIAQQTLSDANTREALERTRAMAAGVAQDAFKTAAEMGSKMTAQGLQHFQQATAAAARAPAAASAQKAAPKREAPSAGAAQAAAPAPKPGRKTASRNAPASKVAPAATRKKASAASASTKVRRSKPSSS